MNNPALVSRVDSSALPAYSAAASALGSALNDSAANPRGAGRVWGAVRRYWWVVLLVWLVLAVPATYLIYTRIKPKFVAQGYVLVSPVRTAIINGRDEVSPFYTEHLRTQAAIMRSPQLLREAATESPELRNYPFFTALPDQVQYLRETVSVIPTDQTVVVTATHENADFAKDAVNAILARYRGAVEVLEQKRTRTLMGVLDDMSKGTTKLIDDYKLQLKTLVSDEKQITSDEERKIFTESAAKVRSALTDLENSRISLEGSIEALKKRTLPDETTFKAAVPVENDNQLQRWQQELTRINVTDQILESKGATAKHPDRKEYARQRAKLTGLIAERTAQIREDAWQRESAQLRLQRSEQLDKLENDFKSVDTQLAKMKDRVDSDTSTATTMKSKAFEIDHLKDQITEQRDTLKQLMDRRREIESMNALPGRVAEHAEAIRPATALVDSRPRAAIAANGGALLIGFLVLVVLVKLRNTIDGSDDLPDTYKPLVVGTVSHAGNSPRGLHGKMRRKILGEEMRLVHANLLPPGRGERRIMMVTSPTPGNGKTSISSHLALSLAKSGFEVLLIDADLRKRDLSTMFDVGFRPGLAELLQGKVPDLVQPVELLPNLRLMGAGGKLERNPVELFQRKHFRESIDLLQDKFDCIIVDTPPTLVVADARLIASSCDEIICVVRAQMTSQAEIDQAIDALGRVTGKTPKLIVNGVEHRQSYYKYKFSYTRDDAAEDIRGEPATPGNKDDSLD